ncbi:MAG: phage tail tube protein [Planctomycetota bacterium]
MSPSGDSRHYPRRRHVRLCAEQSWRTLPAEPDWTSVPVVGDGFSVRAERDYFRPRELVGGPAAEVRLPEMLRVEGELVTRPYPELTGCLLHAALVREGGELPSYCLEHFTPAEPRRITGARVRRLVLEADRDGAILRVAFTAADEEARPELTEDAFDYTGIGPVPFRLVGAAITAAGRALTGVEEFVLMIGNELAAGPNTGGTVGFLAAGRRTVRLRLLAPDDASDFHESVRSGTDFAFQATMTHPAGHTLVLSLPALRGASNREQARPGELVRGELRAEAATDAAGNDFTYLVNLIE